MHARVLFPFVWLIALAPAFSAEAPPPVEASTLTGKVMCGYQGWFSTPGDGNNLGWGHYGFGKPGQCHIDLWPDLSGFGADELFETPLKFADGTPASVFSSGNAKTVERHFEWMKAYGIDGVFLQRFGASVRDPRSRAFRDKVQEAVRASARRNGRTWALMYDLSGLKAGEIESVVMQDWKRQRNELHITDDGKGFDPAVVTAGNGLANMRNRCEQLGGTWRLQSQPGKGTSITCSFAQLA